MNKKYLDHTYHHPLKLLLDPHSSLRLIPKTLPDALGLAHTPNLLNSCPPFIAPSQQPLPFLYQPKSLLWLCWSLSEMLLPQASAWWMLSFWSNSCWNIPLRGRLTDCVWFSQCAGALCIWIIFFFIILIYLTLFTYCLLKCSVSLS